jgi:hypothetical protein
VQTERTKLLSPSSIPDIYAHIGPRTPECQARAVYNWEHSYFAECLEGDVLTLSECQELVNRVWMGLNLIAPPKVSDGRGSNSARAWGDRIMLPRWARNFAVVIHEIAHCVVHLFDLTNSLDHGGVFVHVFCKLISKHSDRRYNDMRKSALASNVVVTRVKMQHRLNTLFIATK